MLTSGFMPRAFCSVVELAFVDGQWQPARLKPLFPVIVNPAASLHGSGFPSENLSTTRLGSGLRPAPSGAHSRTLSAAPSKTSMAVLPPTEEGRPC